MAIDLFCGLGGWTEGLLAEGYSVVGFDIERHQYGDARYPAQLVIQDVLTLHGSQFRDAALIVASPPCQAYSYRAMPWKRAKALPPPSNELFDACFRIQREACEAAGRHIPLVVENVKGAQPWVGRAAWHYGSFYLWGDVPALMPHTSHSKNGNQGGWFAIGNAHNKHCPDGRRHTRNLTPDGMKVPGFNFHAHEKGIAGGSFQSAAVKSHVAGAGEAYGGGFGWDGSAMRTGNSKSPARKAASAMIAKIPTELARHIARCYYPQPMEKVG